MSRLRSVWHRLLTLVGRPRLERDLDDEVRFHLEMEIEQNRARGMSRREARSAALRSFGGVDQVKEACRDERGVPWLETTVQDARWAVRSLRKTPAFTLTAIVVLALGVGGTTALFSVVHGVLLEPLPLPEPDRLVALWESNEERGWDRANAAPANLLDWRERTESFTGITAHSWTQGWALSGVSAGPERIRGVQVLGNFFEVFGVAPRIGPGLDPEAHWATGEKVVVLSHGLWQRRFGGDREIVGRRIELDGVPRTVAGVAPPGFTYPEEDLDAWIPFDWQPGFRSAVWFRRAHMLRPVGRLAPGVGVDRAREELAAVADRLAEEYPETNRNFGAGLTPLREWTTGDAGRPLWILLAATGLVLLVACADVANLLLARTTARGRELALRSALGAPRTRIVRQLVTESLTLAAFGGLAGIALAYWGTRVLGVLAREALPRLDAVSVDGPVLAFAVAVTAAAGLLFGVGPALRMARAPAARALQGGARGGSSRGGGKLGLPSSRRLLVLSEVALAVILVVGAGLLLRSFRQVMETDPGFRSAGRAAMSFDLPEARYPESERVLALQRELLERLEARAGVESAALASSLPLEGAQWTADFTVDDWPPDRYGIDFARRIVSPGYFQTMGVPVLLGRGFRPGDDESSRPVVVVNETLARQHFGDQSPVGRRIAFTRDPADASVWREVVGVVGDEAIESLTAGGRPEIFVPLGQELLGEPGLPHRHPDLVVHTAGADPATAVPVVRGTLHALDPALPLYDVRTLEQMVARDASRQRLLTTLLGLFALVALALATVGIYGLMSYSVLQQRREIGVRLALGARPGRVVGRIVGRGMALFGAGLALGLAGALVLARVLESLLFRVEPTDPTTLALAAALLTATALAATLLPARTAARIDPMETLRTD